MNAVCVCLAGCAECIAGIYPVADWVSSRVGGRVGSRVGGRVGGI